MSSLFTARLGTNYSPSYDDIRRIRSLLVEPTLRLKQLDDKIVEFQKAIDELSKERSGIAAYVDAYQALLSPIRRMPLEILKEIFITCLPTDRNCTMSASEAPILLGRICSAWRTISFSTPPLWARLNIVDPRRSVPRRLLGDPATQDRMREMLAKNAEVVKDWLGRSSPYPLSISLVLDTEDTGDSHILFAALREYSTRWRQIDFSLPLTLIHSMRQLFASDVPMLQSVVLRQTMSYSNGAWGGAATADWSTLDIFRTPALSTVGVFGISQPLDLPLSWDKLTNLSIRDIPWNSNIHSDTVLDIISKTTHLSRFEVTIREHPTGQLSEFGGVSVKSTSLQSLSLCFADLQRLTFLDQLELPNLRELRLLGAAQDQDPPSFIRFFSVSYQLESLYLATELFSTETLLELFHALPPMIQRLGIEEQSSDGSWGHYNMNTKFNDQVLGLLTPGACDGPVLCPELQYFTARSCLFVSDAAVLRFVRARMEVASGPSLKRVSFQFSREKTLDIQAELQLSMEVGVDVSLIYPQRRTQITSPPYQFLMSDDIWDPSRGWY